MTTAHAARCELVTIPISHYCEKARWALDRARVPYRERAHLQGIHSIVARRAGGGSTVPVLVCGSDVLRDSSDILAFADARGGPERALYPAEPGPAAETRALERDFDERLGPHGRRWMYHEMRGQRALVLAYACTGVPAWQRRVLPVAYPAVVRLIDSHLDITPATAAESLRAVRATFDAVAERLGDGRPFLIGDRFTAADLTFAALAAAVLVPPEYGTPLPQPGELPEPVARDVRAFREHPAGAFAMRLFREQRRSAAA